ncbi:uncharacterized protein MELLADRAFT_106629 [Melampsora larici-populina 98AG31]|uniref:Uncharacterized protein n=1 Tax=Melampsora larici-populina (strain 98AG31 / pathotype 3-4-7) TaxID=747676 RepID=F4RM48_MELLP|nr:uncharacterized protein MELLADRAFT_106629 [Melampsora larici-populina 98AG31]EGG06362.1 hypothetical protein MELLADRAFT_106629 [Melampsora larici-populina 98AG31]
MGPHINGFSTENLCSRGPGLNDYINPTNLMDRFPINQGSETSQVYQSLQDMETHKDSLVTYSTITNGKLQQQKMGNQYHQCTNHHNLDAIIFLSAKSVECHPSEPLDKVSPHEFQTIYDQEKFPGQVPDVPYQDLGNSLDEQWKCVPGNTREPTEHMLDNLFDFTQDLWSMQHDHSQETHQKHTTFTNVESSVKTCEVVQKTGGGEMNEVLSSRSLAKTLSSWPVVQINKDVGISTQSTQSQDASFSFINQHDGMDHGQVHEPRSTSSVQRYKKRKLHEIHKASDDVSQGSFSKEHVALASPQNEPEPSGKIQNFNTLYQQHRSALQQGVRTRKIIQEIQGIGAHYLTMYGILAMKNDDWFLGFVKKFYLIINDRSFTGIEGDIIKQKLIGALGKVKSGIVTGFLGLHYYMNEYTQGPSLQTHEILSHYLCFIHRYIDEMAGIGSQTIKALDMSIKPPWKAVDGPLDVLQHLITIKEKRHLRLYLYYHLWTRFTENNKELGCMMSYDDFITKLYGKTSPHHSYPEFSKQKVHSTTTLPNIINDNTCTKYIKDFGNSCLESMLHKAEDLKDFFDSLTYNLYEKIRNESSNLREGVSYTADLKRAIYSASHKIVPCFLAIIQITLNEHPGVCQIQDLEEILNDGLNFLKTQFSLWRGLDLEQLFPLSPDKTELSIEDLNQDSQIMAHVFQKMAKPAPISVFKKIQWNLVTRWPKPEKARHLQRILANHKAQNLSGWLKEMVSY